MKDLKQNVLTCMKKLDAIGIEYGNIVAIKINTRAKCRWGQCRNLGNGRYEININVRLLDDDAPQTGLDETILHELAHSVNGCMMHNAKWKSVVARINRAYGYNIKRTNSEEDKGLAPIVDEVEHKYIVRCTKCGYELYRSRMCKLVEHPEHYIHSTCRCAFERVK